MFIVGSHPPPALFGRAAGRSYIGSDEGRSSEESRVAEPRRAIHRTPPKKELLKNQKL
jgi:hypothetical protein